MHRHHIHIQAIWKFKINARINELWKKHPTTYTEWVEGSKRASNCYKRNETNTEKREYEIWKKELLSAQPHGGRTTRVKLFHSNKKKILLFFSLSSRGREKKINSHRGDNSLSLFILSKSFNFDYLVKKIVLISLSAYIECLIDHHLSI